MKNYFDNENKEFIIRDMYPRRPWINYFWNNQTMGDADQFGRGSVFSMVANEDVV